jgi:hypothetical protein
MARSASAKTRYPAPPVRRMFRGMLVAGWRVRFRSGSCSTRRRDRAAVRSRKREHGRAGERVLARRARFGRQQAGCIAKRRGDLCPGWRRQIWLRPWPGETRALGSAAERGCTRLNGYRRLQSRRRRRAERRPRFGGQQAQCGWRRALLPRPPAAGPQGRG